MPKKKTEAKKEEAKTMTPREIRKAAYEKKMKEQKVISKVEEREEFKKYFVKLKRKLNLESSIEEVMWKHFKAAGFTKKEKFDAGVKHFGYEI